MSLLVNGLSDLPTETSYSPTGRKTMEVKVTLEYKGKKNSISADIAEDTKLESFLDFCALALNDWYMDGVKTDWKFDK